MALSQEVRDGYNSTLQDLTFNSKPLINALTMLADENVANAKDIVEVIETHLAKVRTEIKLPVLYLIDCIIKNVGEPYTSAFCNNIVNIFCSVFEVVDEKTRTEMYKLRQTWNEVIPKSKLYALDVKTKQLDPAWPITAQPPTIHFNPKFLNSTKPTIGQNDAVKLKPNVPLAATLTDPTLDMKQKLILKQKQLLELQQKKLELELLQTQVQLQEQQRKSMATNNVNLREQPTINVDNNQVIQNSKQMLLKPQVAKELLDGDSLTKTIPLQINSSQRFVSGGGSVMPNIVPMNNNMNSVIGGGGGAATAIRPIRDPRLLRAQQGVQQPVATPLSVQVTPQLDLVTANAVAVAAAAAAAAASAATPLSLDNKNVSNNLIGRESRFVDNNKDDEPKVKTFSRIPLKSKRSSSPATTVSSSTATNSTAAAAGIGTSSSLSSRSSKSSSTSSLDSPVKKSSRSKSPSKSSSRHKKSRTEKRSSKGGRDRTSRSPTKGGAFKDPKGTKGRNYVRRNRTTSISPDEDAKKDLDLRASSGPPEKQPKLVIDLEVSDDLDSKRTGKKRLSSEITDSVANKKNKTELFDALFGNEDVDLRKISGGSERPITPPAPIISKKNETTEKENSKNGTDSENPVKINLDALRAKLAEATNRNKLNKARDKEELVDKSKDIVGKIISKVENQKAKELSRKEVSNEDSTGVLTQPISDDEFDSDIDNKPTKVEEQPVSSKQSRFGREPAWKLKRGAQYMGPRPSRARPEPWIRPINQGIWNPPLHIFDDEKSNDALDCDRITPPQQQQLPHVVQPEETLFNSCNNIKSINIDGEPKDIIFYGETAVAFMSPDDPRELSFQAGQRRVCFGDSCSFVLYFNDAYREVLINGQCHRIRLGAPTREIYIDGKPYECIFGGSPMRIELDRKIVLMQLEGPMPQVKIGTVKRTDLVVGKVSLIIDAKTVVPIYLDARTQTFELDGQVNTVRFRDALKTILINERPQNLEFGGLPKAVILHGRKHFVRFSVLPRGIQPGNVLIKDMDGYRPSASTIVVDDGSQDGYDLEPPPVVIPPVLPPATVATTTASTRRKTRFSNPSPERTLIPPQPIVNFDPFGTMGASNVPPRINNPIGMPSLPLVNEIPKAPVTTVPPPVANPIPPVLNIDDLFQKLVATGIMATVQNPPPMTINNVPPPLMPPSISTINAMSSVEVPAPVPMPTPNVSNAPPNIADFKNPSTLKIRQPNLIQEIYAGMQCSSCGMRFASDNTSLYSQHLDWHFRQNRKGKKNSRKASSRRWYYSISDWNSYEEIEDLEEREKCYFENQQKDQAEAGNDEGDTDIEIPSVPADSNVPEACCDVCQEKFEQFYNEDKEEWHLRMAIRIEDKTYHPLCYEDYQAALLNTTANESMDQSKIESSMVKSDEITTIPGLDVEMEETAAKGEESPEIVLDEAVETEEEEEDTAPVKTADEDNKDAEPKESNPTETIEDEAEQPKSDADEVPVDEDDDVIIQEEKIEKIVLDEYEFKHPLGENGLIPGVVVKEEPIDEEFAAIENKFKNGEPQKGEGEPETGQDESFEDIGQVVVPDPNLVAEESATEALNDASSNQDLGAPLDGNLDCNAGVNVQQPPGGGGLSGKIKINISKPLPVIAPKENNKDIPSDNDNTVDPVDPIQPLPPGEEPVQLNLKPALLGVELKQLPPVNKGSELTGLCSIM